jgi:endonuclease/exonuclease/phosphatase family metal-dependent hydrolase
MFLLLRRICNFSFISACGLLIVLTDVGASQQVAAEPVELKVMSVNIRYSYGKPQEPAPENDWYDPHHPRRNRAIQVVRDYMPDILGVQEARDLQIVDFREALPEYGFYGLGRDDGKTEGEYTGIFYRKERFERPGAGSFWLSATPEMPGTSFYTVPGAVPRMASWVLLREKTSGQEVMVLNTHFDHISVPAREKSAALIRNRLTQLAEEVPAIVMGDLNTQEDTTAYRELVGSSSSGAGPLIDSYRKLHPRRTKQESTFNHWKGTIEGSRIDFILHTDDFTPTAAEIVRTSYDDRLPSDHYPVTATLRLEPHGDAE